MILAGVIVVAVVVVVGVLLWAVAIAADMYLD